MDLRSLAAGEMTLPHFVAWEDAMTAIERMPIPFIAAINGHCLGGGLQLALVCDYRLAAADAVIGLPAVKECLIPSMALYRLPRLIGAARAREMILTGEPISAARAADYGLLNQVVPASEFARALDECIGRFLALPPTAVGVSKAPAGARLRPSLRRTSAARWRRASASASTPPSTAPPWTRSASGGRDPRDDPAPTLLPTSVIGSHGLPGWVWLAREALEAGRLGATDVRELMEDATQVALLDQERAGIDVLTTGEMGRVRFIIGFYDHLRGIRTMEEPRKLGQPHWDTNTPFEVVERITAPAGLGIVDEFKLARSLTGRPLKATVPGPYTLMFPLRLGGGYRDRDTLLADLVGIVNAECRALVAAGADFIQIDEPHSGMYAGAAPNFAQGVNRAVEGVRAKIAVHVCFGNLYGRPFQPVRSYRNVYPAIHELTASQVVLEYANRGMDDLALWKEFPTDKELGAGVIDVKAFKAETAEEVAERIRALLRYVAPDKLWLNPDCGFWETPRWATRLKMAALVEGARHVRRELEGSGLELRHFRWALSRLGRKMS